jgi:sugar transferase (PEP-CTERM/EpsH1 system associated)
LALVRILFVVPRHPFPPHRGDRVRAWHQLRVLARRHEVTLLALERPAAGAAVPDGVRVVTAEIPAARRAVSLARHLVSDLPLQAALFDVPSARDAVATLVEEGFDLAHLQLVRLAPLAPLVCSVPCVVDFVDALSLNIARRAERDVPPLRPLWRLEAARLRRAERALLDRVGQGVVVSEADRAAMGGDERLAVVPNGVDGAAFAFEGRPRDNADILFAGNLGYFANADAATWFAREVFPRLRARAPRARLRIVGARPPRAVRALSGLDGVAVAGEVPDMAAHVRAARVAVAPLRAGSGQQSKVLEAMACGTPVVASRLAASGMEAAHEEHLLVADGAEATASAVLRLIEDAPLCARLAANGRRLVEERYTWERSVEGLEAAYRRARRRE